MATETRPKVGDRYLGDGVYASFDGFSVVLDLRAQDSTTKIVLEPEVAAALHRYCLYAFNVEEETDVD